MEKAKIEQIKSGNFALLPSQQPGPLISFGQNMLDQHDLQFFWYTNDLIGENKNLTSVIPEFLYGIRDNFSVLFELPIASVFQVNDEVYQGLQDIFVQLEYAIVDKTTYDTTSQVTLVGNVTFPTGGSPSIHQQNFGSLSFHGPTFFFGTTMSHMTRIWYPFVSVGTQITTTGQNTKLGNQILYQAGLGRNISSNSDKYIFNVLIEFDGSCKEKNKNYEIIDQNSGGNQILLGPSCWFSTTHFTFQAGASWVVYQKLNGIQNKNNYCLAIDVGYKF
ncbi:hypothetical protein KBB68_04020 [Candidatus Babeliales bacterium]|nr:hypothetical protein [Candidatus Babeliales bacterium]